MGWVGWWVAHVILVSALGPNPSFFPFWGTFIQLGGLLGQGLELGLGPGLDNKVSHPMSTFSIGFIVLDKHLIQGLSRPTARMLYYFEVFTRWSIFCLDS